AARPAPAEADFFGGYSPAVTFAAGVILVLAIGVIDKLTGYDLHLGVLYLLPITMVTWSAGLGWGLALSLGTAALWLGIFSAAFEDASAAELARRPAREARFILADGRPALLRILSH